MRSRGSSIGRSFEFVDLESNLERGEETGDLEKEIVLNFLARMEVYYIMIKRMIDNDCFYIFQFWMKLVKVVWF